MAMPKIYSMDIRNLAIKKVHSGERRAAVSLLLDIGLSTLDLWLAKYRSEGHVKPQERGRYETKKVSDEALLSYIEAHPDATLETIGNAVGGSQGLVHYRCNVLNITRKKKHAISGTRRSKKT